MNCIEWPIHLQTLSHLRFCLKRTLGNVNELNDNHTTHSPRTPEACRSVFSRMEESAAAAYYDDLLQRGSGAAKFKQGLGFGPSATSDSRLKPTLQAGSSDTVLESIRC